MENNLKLSVVKHPFLFEDVFYARLLIINGVESLIASSLQHNYLWIDTEHQELSSLNKNKM
jgi:hypothetical protein